MKLAGADTQQGFGALQGGLPIQQGGAPFQYGGLVTQQGGVTAQQEVTPVQHAGRPIQHGGHRRRLFAEYDPAVIRMAKIPRLSTMTIPQVGSRHASLLGLPQRLFTGQVWSTCMSIHPCIRLTTARPSDVRMNLPHLYLVSNPLQTQ